MRTAALVYAGSISAYALSPLAGGESAFARALAYAKNIPGLTGILVLEGEVPLPEKALEDALCDVAGGAVAASAAILKTKRSSWSVASVLSEAERFSSSLESEGPLDALVIVAGDEPLLDAALLSRMLENHGRYRADYSFADGYPQGFAAEILAPHAIPALRALAEKSAAGAVGTSDAGKVERGWLFSLIQKDINSFDIETDISPRDLRELRLDLACDTKRNSLLVERLMEAGVHDAASALDYIPGHLEALRSLPAFLQVQVAGGCPQACALCPYPQVGGAILARRDFMPRERFAALVSAFASFAGEGVVDISLWGEPSFHPEVEGLVDDVLSHPSLSLIVETSGIGWKEGAFERLSARWPERLHFVLSLDAVDPELYASLRGPGFEEALASAGKLLSLFPRSAYVQTLRVRENEPALEDFWRGWKKRTDHVIVQKYSRFAGFLPPRKVTDLSPLKRRPCWHLKRDLSVLLDGGIPLCRDCVRGEVMLGNAFASPRGLAEAWAAGEAYHLAHVRASLTGDAAYPPPCAACDEYYTYNA